MNNFATKKQLKHKQKHKSIFVRNTQNPTNIAKRHDTRKYHVPLYFKYLIQI